MSARSERIYVIKDGERIGPYSIDELLDRVDRGEILYEDFCLRQGDARHVPVREVLDWDDDDWREAGWDDEEPDGDFEDDYEDEDDEDDDDDDDDENAQAPWPEPTPRPARPSRSRSRSSAPDLDDPSVRLYHGHPALLSFPKSLLLIAIAITQGIVLWNHNGWFLFGGLLVALAACGYILFERSMKLYLITPKRIEIVHGFIARNSNEVRITDIRAINVKKPGFIGLLGVGSVEFASAGGDDVEVVFTQVSHPEGIKSLVRRLQDRR